MSRGPKAKGGHGFASSTGFKPCHPPLPSFREIAQLLGWERLRVGLWAQEDFASYRGCPGLECLKKTADLAYGKLCFLARLLSHR